MQKNFFISILIFLVIIFFFYFFKIFKDVNKINYDYYKINIILILSLSILTIFLIFLKKKYQTYIIITLLSIFIGSYILEIYLSFYQPQGIYLKKKIRLHRDLNGKVYDTRDKYDFYKYLKKKDKNVTLAVSPRFYSEINLYSLSGISSSNTILCNELGTYSMYLSDRHGFNNPDQEWDSKRINYFIVGDSFAHGACVNRPFDIASNLRKISKGSVLNLGYSGNSPLEEFATLREYLNKNVDTILWLYYPNDLLDLTNKLGERVLNNYLENENFSQKLIFKQKIIDEEAKKIINKKNYEKKKFDLHRFLVLNNLRGFIFSYLPSKYLTSNTQSNLGDHAYKFFEILMKTKKIASQNNSNLYFVYLPDYSFYKKNYNNEDYNYIKKILVDLDINFIDIHELVFKKQKNPYNLFPFGLPGHYNKIGYQKVSQAIHEFIIKENTSKE